MASPMPRFLPAIVSRAAAIALGCWCILRCFWNRMLTGHGVKWLAPGLKWRSWRRVKVRRLEPIRICVEDWVPKNNRGFSGLSWSIGAMAYFRLVLGIIKQPWIRYLGERHRMVVSWWSQWFFHILSILFHPWQFSGTRWFLLIPISLLKHHDSKKKPSWPPKNRKKSLSLRGRHPFQSPATDTGSFPVLCVTKSWSSSFRTGTRPRNAPEMLRSAPAWRTPPCGRWVEISGIPLVGYQG